jgi:hypothetical protein
MFRRTLCALPWLAAGCVATPAPPAPPVRAAPARRPAEAGLPQRVRRDPWMTRFWEELTPAQRRRVLARLRNGDPAVTGEADAAKAWDVLGLPQRNALLFGDGARPRQDGLAAAIPASAPP